MSLALIVGLSAVAFLFLYFCFNLSSSDGEGDKHFLLKLLLLFFFLWTILLIPKATMDDKTTCEYVLNNVTTSAPTDYYNYTYTCQTTTTSTEFNFYKTVLWFIRIFLIYWFIYLVYAWGKSNEWVSKLLHMRK